MKAQLIGYLLRGCHGDHADYSSEKRCQKHKNKMKVCSFSHLLQYFETFQWPCDKQWHSDMAKIKSTIQFIKSTSFQSRNSQNEADRCECNLPSIWSNQIVFTFELGVTYCCKMMINIPNFHNKCSILQFSDM
jgi:phage gp16-like protein